MIEERLCQRRIAWIPWVLAVVALLGINALSGNDSQLGPNDNGDGVGLSVAAKDLWTAGRVSDPLIFGPPPQPINTVHLDPGSTFVKLEAGKNFIPASLRHGVARGRAPPSDA